MPRQPSTPRCTLPPLLGDARGLEMSPRREMVVVEAGGGASAAPPGRRLRKDRDIYETFPGAAAETAGFAGDHVSTSPHSYERSRSPVTSGSPARAGRGSSLRTPVSEGGGVPATPRPTGYPQKADGHQPPSSAPSGLAGPTYMCTSLLPCYTAQILLC